MKKILLLTGLLMTAGLFTMAQTHPKKDTTSKPTHVKSPKKTTDTTHHKKH
jgi:hypothetical protein